MIFEFRPSFADQYQASFAVMLRSPLQLLLMPAFPLAGLVATVLAYRRAGSVSPIHILVLFLCFAFTPNVLAFNVWLSRRKNRTIEGLHRYAVDEAGLAIAAPAFDVHLKWSALHRVVETPRYFLFFLSTQTAYFIPKAVVGDRAAELRAIISHGISTVSA
ncbi:MAG: YcxB family protein [Acidobacteria bacterium]|nr:YcxB family protein [Acidobacteriota bacterium]